MTRQEKIQVYCAALQGVLANHRILYSLDQRTLIIGNLLEQTIKLAEKADNEGLFFDADAQR